jgi:hypothetical protein
MASSDQHVAGVCPPSASQLITPPHQPRTHQPVYHHPRTHQPARLAYCARARSRLLCVTRTCSGQRAAGCTRACVRRSDGACVSGAWLGVWCWVFASRVAKARGVEVPCSLSIALYVRSAHVPLRGSAAMRPPDVATTSLPNSATVPSPDAGRVPSSTSPHNKEADKAAASRATGSDAAATEATSGEGAQIGSGEDVGTWEREIGTIDEIGTTDESVGSIAGVGVRAWVAVHRSALRTVWLTCRPERHSCDAMRLASEETPLVAASLVRSHTALRWQVRVPPALHPHHLWTFRTSVPHLPSADPRSVLAAARVRVPAEMAATHGHGHRQQRDEN